jgi:hypothetical protein
MNEIQATGQKAHRGGMLLTFGILGIVCCFIFGILAWVMGGSDLKEMAEGRMDPSGEGLTKAGKILGIVGCVLAILGLAIGLATGALGALAGASSAFN